MMTARSTTGIVSALAVLLAPIVAPAQLTNDVVVTARAIPRAASATPGGVSIIGESDLSGRVVTGLADTFRMAPGVSAVSDSPWGSELAIRGLSRESVVMIIDGARVNTATDLNARSGMIDPSSIERIEILKGPISSLYGSGSLGGTVNIITKKPLFSEQPVINGSVRISGESNPQGWQTFLSAGRSGPSTAFLVNQGWRHAGDFKDGDGKIVSHTQYTDMQTGVKAVARINPDSTIELNLQRFAGEDIGIPGAGSAPLPDFARVTYPDIGRTLASLTYCVQPCSGPISESRVNLFSQAVQRRVRIDDFPEASPLLAVYPSADHETTGLNWMNAIEAGRHEITAGTDVWQRRIGNSHRDRVFKDGHIVADQPLPDPECLSAGVFCEDDVRISDAVTFNAGGRMDFMRVRNDPDDTWDEITENEHGWNYHGGLTWLATDRLALKCIAARGYRAASLEEQYQYLELGGGITQWGNPDLVPEQSEFVECGVLWAGDSFNAGISAYRNSLRNLIGELKTDPSTIVNANIDSALIEGYEAELRFLTGPVSEAYGNATLSVGRDTGTGEYLPWIPPVNGLVGFLHGKPDEKGCWGRAELVFAGKQDRTPPEVPAAPGWTRTDIGLGWNCETGHGVFAEIRNLFDQTYSDYMKTFRGNTYNDPGRSLTVGYKRCF